MPELELGMRAEYESKLQSQAHARYWFWTNVTRLIVDQITKATQQSNSRRVELSNDSLAFVMESIFDYTI